METEFEAKFYPAPKDIKGVLARLNAELVHPERLMRRVIFQVSDNSPLNGMQCDYVRVRQEGESVHVSAKTHANASGRLQDQKEADIDIGNYPFEMAVDEIQRLIGAEPDNYQETTRETWNVNGVKVTIDTWPGLPSYIEVESASIEDTKSVSEMLGFKWEDKIITSVLEVFMQVYGLTREQALDKLSYITFENNPFEGMERKNING